MAVSTGYNGNPNLPKGASQYQLSPQQKREFKKCMDDPVYFAETYFKIVHVDHGLIKFKLYDYQKDAIRLADSSRKFVMNASRQCGKCISIDTTVNIRQTNTTDTYKLTVRDFIKLLLSEADILDVCKTDDHLIIAFMILSASNNYESTDKLIASLELSGWELESDSGFAPASHLHLTKKYESWIVKTSRGYNIRCADDHIVFLEGFNQIYVKDISVGDSIIVSDGVDIVESVVKLDSSEHMFDFTVNSKDHRYYTNDILSHNTSVATVIILHYALFNEDKKIALLANKADTAQEILSRIQLAYEHLPNWLKCGVIEWNKRRVEFDNGSIIMAAASSASSIRGQSCVSGDTMITVKSKLTGLVETISMTELQTRLHRNKDFVKYQKDIGLTF